MKTRAVSLLFLATSSLLWARLGETEKELTTRFGKPVARAKLVTYAQGKSWELGTTLTYRQDDWVITSDLVDDRVVREEYQKRGEWTVSQIQTVVAANAQGAQWTEISAKGSEKWARKWKRTDGATAQWNNGAGFKFSTPAYDRAKEVAEAKAKVEVSRTPKI